MIEEYDLILIDSAPSLDQLEWGSAEATALGAIYAEHQAAIEGDPS